jgi:4-amino-4-deoxy-L-arabinose transferase-like glycosyltransferase
MRWMVTLLLLGLVARIGAGLTVGGDFHFADEAIYVDAARRLSAGGGYGIEYQRVPAYPVFLLLLSLGLPAGVTFLRVTQAIVAALGTLLVFWLADRMFGRRVAIVAGLVYALDPLLVISSGLLYPETVAALLVPAVVLAALGASQRDAVARSALAGALVGILALLRPVALVLLPVVAVWTTLTVSARPLRRMAHLGALALAFLLVLTPWTVRNMRVHGGLVPVAAAGIEAAPVGADEIARRGLLTSMARWVWSDPGGFVGRVSREFVLFWELAPTRMATDDPVKRQELHRKDPRLPVQPLFSRSLRDQVSAASFGLELVLALVGLVAVARTRWRQALLPVVVILAYAAGYALFVAKLRYRIPILPLVFLFTGVGAAAVYSFVRRAGSESRHGQTSDDESLSH